jgi:hypothetical protein
LGRVSASPCAALVTKKGTKFGTRLVTCASLRQGLEGVMRLRCSTGLSVASCSGAFCKHTTTDLDLPAVDCNKAFLFTLKHDDKLPPDGNEVSGARPSREQ